MKRLLLALLCAVVLLGFSYRPMHANPVQAECPVSLSNPDGQALVLEKYHLRVAAHGALSLTEAEMVFRNPENRQMEGRFLYLLPPDATISRFAKDVNGKLMEGEVVEKLRAQSIYTEILHTMRDPALLEMDQGNRFSARVFPIPPNGTVRLVLSYSQLLKSENGERKLVLPLAGMPSIGEFKLSALMKKAPGETIEKNLLLDAPAAGDEVSMVNHTVNNYKPEKDIAFTFKLNEGVVPARAIKSAHYQMLTYRPTLQTKAQKEENTDWVFYIDTSASNADMERHRLSALKALYSNNDVVSKAWTNTVFAFDVNVAALKVSVPLGDADKNPIAPADSLERALLARHALGATNLENALKHLGNQARENKGAQRFVIVTDGIATLGAREAGEIVKALGEWPENDTLHALVLGSKQDQKMLNAIVEKTRGRVVTLPLTDKFETQIPKVVAELREPVGASFEFYDEGAAWIFPKTFRDVRPGSELVVFSELKEGAAAKPGVIQRGANGKVVHEQALEVPASEMPDFAPLLQREACAALLNHLEKQEQNETNAARKDELRKQRLNVSVKSRVLCPLTSLLVLESENDYQRFGIERTALADVMQIGKNGIELRKRQPDEVPHTDPGQRVPPAKKGEARNGGALKDGVEKAKADAPSGGPGEARQRGLALDADKSDGRGFGGGGGQQVERLERRRNEDDRAQPRERQLEADESRAGAPPAPQAAAPTATAVPDPNADRRNNAPALRNKSTAPDWTTQYKAVPTEQQLDALRAQVAGKPQDRTLRNMYSAALFKAGKWDSLQGEAFQWLPFDPENPQVFEYLGKSAAGLNDNETALRAITSIAEIAPNRAALLSRAGYLLLTAKQYDVAEQMFREGLKNRPDEANIIRGLAMSLWLNKQYEKAAATLETALGTKFHQRYGDVQRVLREELGYIYRLWMKKEPAVAGDVQQRAAKHNVRLGEYDAVRVTLAWETDANDVDLHVVDPNGEECFYSHKNNASGLELYSDQTQGLGPEVIRTKKALAGEYHAGVNYFSAGPMGVSRGIIVVFQPVDGVDENPRIVPFCLVPGGENMRHLAAVEVK